MYLSEIIRKVERQYATNNTTETLNVISDVMIMTGGRAY